jgi:DNA repair exonuclease SbcCD ATPase subunit
VGSKRRRSEGLFPATEEPEGGKHGLLEKCPTCGRPLEEHERERVTLTWRTVIKVYEEGLKEGERRSRLWGVYRL